MTKIFKKDFYESNWLSYKKWSEEYKKDLETLEFKNFYKICDDAKIQTTNPKDLLGIKKDSISLVPPEGIRQIAKAMKNGADKYGPYNWRNKKVQYIIYLDAILRHTLLLIEGEDLAEDSQVHHLAHIGANTTILLDAIKYNCLVDNRPKKDNK